MFELLLTMVERLGILVMIAFILTRLRFFRDLVYQDELNKKQQLTAILFFGFFGVIGTYSGLALNVTNFQMNPWVKELSSDEAIANSRVIGVVMAGLLGGYKIGIGAGLIAGIHRMTLGGFTAISCGISTIIAGILAGKFHEKNKMVNGKKAFFIGALAETIQMGIIILISRPIDKAIALVEMISVPMVLANGIGCSIFLMIIKNVIHEEERVGATSAQKSLRIANKTIAHLRNGLTYETAYAVCQILHKEINTSAVSITNRTHILAHVGLGEDHHKARKTLQTQITLNAIRKGEMVISDKKNIQCRKEGCPLGAVVISPLKHRGQVIGTLKFYFRSKKEITPVIIELIKGLSTLLSNQLEVAEADKAYQLAKEAEIKALQAQISPHFLFNTLNTILSLIRLDQNKARKLLLSLSQFLRNNLVSTTESVTTLAQELEHVKAYLSIVETRFSNRLKVNYDIDEETLYQELPPLTLQPIIENTIEHGFKDKDKDCVLDISITMQGKKIMVKIWDNGIGMDKERVEQISKARIDSNLGSGLALYNVNRRLTIMYGEEAALKIKSKKNKGTEVSFVLPKKGDLYAANY